MSIRTVLDKVVLRLLKKEEKSDGGIVIPESAQVDADRGTVVAIGPRVTDVYVGYEVLLSPKAKRDEIEVNGETLVVVRERDLLAKSIA